MTTSNNLINKSIKFVKDIMKSNDASHDWNHVERVWRMSVQIAKKEQYQGDIEMLELAAILHDVNDRKYSAKNDNVKVFLQQNGYPEEKIATIERVIEEISFSNELENPGKDILLESKIVQDSDRLDAIGAMGIARVFSYGTFAKRPLYSLTNYPSLSAFTESQLNSTKMLTKEEYQKTSNPTINHFYDKLFHLSKMMKTKTGRELAEKRHKTMYDFVNSFNEELVDCFSDQEQISKHLK
ncbi:hypothetical protein DLAC_09586 [Tieghemostelium lacteum]|uniref:HD/PDEase domain-containing protein n=1 Tax=Tieghemostelium lacteum TaxID=361077 RepID=A0A151Z6N7_TIELA|nr:hypothetical protein DLAC_09586 [Tieghemostelium lacteum]|eukprot:KYQ89622.1 hypothetical protein DLAC_09586 [Tieghemostelium lacteum]